MFIVYVAAGGVPVGKQRIGLERTKATSATVHREVEVGGKK